MVGMVMRRRQKMSRKKSKRNFSNGAKNVKKQNYVPAVMRGGTRL